MNFKLVAIITKRFIPDVADSSFQLCFANTLEYKALQTLESVILLSNFYKTYENTQIPKTSIYVKKVHETKNHNLDIIAGSF